MIAFITFKSSLLPLFEGLWSSNSWEFEVSGFRRNRTDDLRRNRTDDLDWQSTKPSACCKKEIRRERFNCHFEALLNAQKNAVCLEFARNFNDALSRKIYKKLSPSDCAWLPWHCKTLQRTATHCRLCSHSREKERSTGKERLYHPRFFWTVPGTVLSFSDKCHKYWVVQPFLVDTLTLYSLRL